MVRILDFCWSTHKVDGFFSTVTVLNFHVWIISTFSYFFKRARLNLSSSVSNAGYIVLRVLLHFSETKKGSKFGLKQNGTMSERLRDEKNGIQDVKKTN